MPAGLLLLPVPWGHLGSTSAPGRTRADAAFRPLFSEGELGCCLRDEKSGRPLPVVIVSRTDEGVRAGTDQPRRKGLDLSKKNGLLEGKLILKEPPCVGMKPCLAEGRNSGRMGEEKTRLKKKV